MHAHHKHMDLDKIQSIYEDRYQSKIGLSYDEWMEQAPETEDQAYARCQELDEQLKHTEDEWREAKGNDKEQLEEYRSRLRLEYELIEEMFGLELDD